MSAISCAIFCYANQFRFHVYHSRTDFIKINAHWAPKISQSTLLFQKKNLRHYYLYIQTHTICCANVIIMEACQFMKSL